MCGAAAHYGAAALTSWPFRSLVRGRTIPTVRRLEAFIVLIQTLTDTAELRAAGIRPPPRQFAIILLGGLRELIAITVEEGRGVGDITEVAVEATMAMLGPRT